MTLHLPPELAPPRPVDAKGTPISQATYTYDDWKAGKPVPF